MALDLSALTAYIDEQNFELATAALIGGRTAGFLTPQVGVKGETIGILLSNANADTDF